MSFSVIKVGLPMQGASTCRCKYGNNTNGVCPKINVIGVPIIYPHALFQSSSLLYSLSFSFSPSLSLSLSLSPSLSLPLFPSPPQELSGRSFVRTPQHNIVRIGVGEQGVYKVDSKTPKVGGASGHIM